MWLVYIPWHFPLHLDNSIQGCSEKAEKEFQKQYPAIYNHLLGYKKQLSARNKAETGIRYEWYALQRWGANYWEDFQEPKIMWKRIGSIIRFSYDSNKSFGLDSTCFATGKNIEFICCVLNSPMGHYLLKDAPKTGTGDLLISVQAVEPIRIPKISDSKNSKFAKLLEKIVKNTDSNAEKCIDEEIFKIYGLEENECVYIKENFS